MHRLLCPAAAVLVVLGALPGQNPYGTETGKAEPAAAVEKQIAQLKDRLQANAKDTVSRGALVRLLLIEQDNPAEAAEYLGEGADLEMRKYVPAAAKGFEAAPELACLELAQWYQGLVIKASAAAKPGLMKRAIGYYQRFVSLHTADDGARTQAQAKLKKAEETLAKIGPAAPHVSRGGHGRG